MSGCASDTRGVFMGGTQTGAPPTSFSTIEYITIATLGNVTNFGTSLAKGVASYPYGCSSITRGICFGGIDYPTTTYRLQTDYITIASTGTCSDFGDATIGRYAQVACSSPTRAICAGGERSGGTTDIIDYIEIASTGNSMDFGDLLMSYLSSGSGCSSNTRGIIAGGAGASREIDYITFSTLGNSTNFGNLTATGQSSAGCSSLIRGVFAGGAINSPNSSDTIGYITIATLGDASNFGVLSVTKEAMVGLSNCHGGL
jgi:hypothetical protein